jgi:hypothetical protein
MNWSGAINNTANGFPAIFMGPNSKFYGFRIAPGMGKNIF